MLAARSDLRGQLAPAGERLQRRRRGIERHQSGAGHIPAVASEPREDSNAGGDLDIAGTVRNLTIAGVAEGVTTIDAAGLGDRVMDVAGGASVSISDLTISGGRAPAGAPGGGSAAGAKGESGGGIRNFGSLTLTRVVVANNEAGDGGGHPDPLNGPAGPGGPGGDGGGIYNGGTLTLIDSEVIYDGAGAGAPGAGLSYDGGAGGAGGGIYNAGALTLTGSTVVADSAGQGGPGSAGDRGGNGNAGWVRAAACSAPRSRRCQPRTAP